MWKLITPSSSLSLAYPVGMSLGLFINRIYINHVDSSVSGGIGLHAWFLNKQVSTDCKKQANTFNIYTFML